MALMRSRRAAIFSLAFSPEHEQGSKMAPQGEASETDQYRTSALSREAAGWPRRRSWRPPER